MLEAALTFTIPGDPGDADAMLGELGELATAAEWKRAAIVYARVRVLEGPGRPTAEKVKSDLLTPAQYAELGIYGLRSPTTIRGYWRAWDNAIKDGLAKPVSLGDKVKLPDAEWGEYYNLLNQSTPPYYRPSGVEALTDPIDTVGSGELGECPPRASDLDESELSVDGEQLDEGADGEREDRAWLPKLQARMLASSLRSMQAKAEYALEYIRSTSEYDRKLVLECVGIIRAVLDDIIAVAGDEPLDKTASHRR